MGEPEIRNKDGLTEQQFLAAYDASRFERPSVTVDMLVFTVTDVQEDNYRKLPQKELRVLLIKRSDHPFIGQWALPGGFVHMDETLDVAAARELMEETNVSGIYMEQLYTFGDVGRDPRTRVISTAYLALVDSSRLNIRSGDDACDARWFTLSLKPYSERRTHASNGAVVTEAIFNLTLIGETEEHSAQVKTVCTVEGRASRVERSVVSSEGIAFDHASIIAYGVERLRNKIEYTDITFNLMPELFTLTELQQVYEIILDTELLKANFRRKTAAMVLETDNYTSDAGHRPSRLYRFNPNWKTDRSGGTV